MKNPHFFVTLFIDAGLFSSNPIAGQIIHAYAVLAHSESTNSRKAKNMGWRSLNDRSNPFFGGIFIYFGLFFL